MKAFLKKHVLDILLILAIVAVPLYTGQPPVSLDELDYIATLGWSVLPLALVWLVLTVAMAAKRYTEARATLLQTEAGLAEANMWAVRHESKRQNEWHKQNTRG